MLSWIPRGLILGLLLGVSACIEAPREALWQTSGKTMGTTYGVQVARCNASICNQQLIEDIKVRLNRLDAQYSHYREDSELSRFNQHRSGEWFPVSHEFAEIVLLANRISAASNGAFDITLGKAVDAWGFGASMRQVAPSPIDVARALDHSGYEKLESRFTPAGLRKTDPDLALDMSAIVKGYAADQIALLLESINLENYVIDIGGELRVSGRRDDGGFWRVGITSPTDAMAIDYLLIPGNNAVATSGDYRNFYFSRGQRISHTIDPANAKPVDHPLSSVTVIDSLGANADAWATALMVMGPEKGFAFAAAHGIPALFLTRSDDGLATQITDAMQAYIYRE